MFWELIWINYICFVFNTFTKHTLNLDQKPRHKLWYSFTNSFFLYNITYIYSVHPELINFQRLIHISCNSCLELGYMYLALILFNHAWKCLDIEVKYKNNDFVYSVASIVTVHLLLTNLLLSQLYFFMFCQSLIGFFKGCGILKRTRNNIRILYPLFLIRNTYHLLPWPIFGSLVAFSCISWNTS